MAAASSYTYDATPPFRPSLADLGGADFEDDQDDAPPPDGKILYADEYNQSKQNVAGLNRVNPVAIVYVTFASGAPTISAVRGMRTSIAPSDFTPTDNGNGDTTIAWSSSLLPASGLPPALSLVDDIEIDRHRAFLVTGGARVKTKLGTSGADCAFILLIF